VYVYLIKSLSTPDKKYIGLTTNLKQRLEEHNRGKSFHTSKYCPWELISATWFQDKEKAKAFEKFLKMGSGHVFAKKHFW